MHLVDSGTCAKNGIVEQYVKSKFEVQFMLCLSTRAHALRQVKDAYIGTSAAYLSRNIT